ncbi:hypothetical protein ACGFNU_09975 [Spirillospora sp. NPDC048911]|uniref:hypothetical protein n=1 Tax=Spirillospora sp. NPDC048911 TaxID=3364527 RepID=UPI0037110B29
MRRTMSYVAPWAGVTALAVTLAWLGVRDVVRSAVSERSAPPPIAGQAIHASPSNPPASVGTPTATPHSTPTPRPSGVPDDRKTPPPAPSPQRSQGPSGSGGRDDPRAGNVRSYATRGGSAALAMSGGKARLVSAIPASGYSTRVTPGQDWLRVDFLGADHTSSVIATWYEHDPIVRVYEY